MMKTVFSHGNDSSCHFLLTCTCLPPQCFCLTRFAFRAHVSVLCSALHIAGMVLGSEPCALEDPPLWPSPHCAIPKFDRIHQAGLRDRLGRSPKPTQLDNIQVLRTPRFSIQIFPRSPLGRVLKYVPGSFSWGHRCAFPEGEKEVKVVSTVHEDGGLGMETRVAAGFPGAS